MNKTQSKGTRAEVGMTKLYVPHLDRELTFIHPYKCPHTYFELKKEIESDIVYLTSHLYSCV